MCYDLEIIFFVNIIFGNNIKLLKLLPLGNTAGGLPLKPPLFSICINIIILNRVMDGELYCKFRSLVYLTPYIYSAIVHLHNALADRKPKTCAFAHILCCNKRVKYSWHDIGRNAFAGICYIYITPAAILHCPDAYLPFPLYCLNSVQKDVRQHLLHLMPVKHKQRQVGREFFFYLYAFFREGISQEE